MRPDNDEFWPSLPFAQWRDIKRNLERFPSEFMFQLTDQELTNLRSQFATSSSSPAWGGRRYPPYAFTAHGAIMAAMVLNSARAIEVSVYVVRAFVQLREAISVHKDLDRKMRELETRIEQRLDDHDQTITEILNAIRQLMAPPSSSRRPIGFVTSKEK